MDHIRSVPASSYSIFPSTSGWLSGVPPCAHGHVSQPTSVHYCSHKNEGNNDEDEIMVQIVVPCQQRFHFGHHFVPLLEAVGVAAHLPDFRAIAGRLLAMPAGAAPSKHIFLFLRVYYGKTA